MPIQLHKTHTLLKAIESMPKVNTFLRDTFFPQNETFVTEDVLMDIKKGKRKMAPVVAPRVGGVTVSREGYRTEKLTAPRLAPQRAITLDDLAIRNVGENVFSNTTPAQRQQKLLATDLLELGETIDRREEWMAAQTLFEGKVVLQGYTGHDNSDTVEQEINYEFENKIVLSGTDIWTNEASDIFESLASARKLAIQKSGIAPDTAILGAKAYEALRNNVKFQKIMDLANMKIASFEPSLVNDAITYIGKVPGLGLELYTYDDWYLNDDGVDVPFVPEDKVLLVKKGFGGFAYGAVTQLEKNGFNTYEGRLIPKQWADQANDILMVRVSARPIPKPGDVNSWVVLEVL